VIRKDRGCGWKFLGNGDTQSAVIKGMINSIKAMKIRETCRGTSKAIEKAQTHNTTTPKITKQHKEAFVMNAASENTSTQALKLVFGKDGRITGLLHNLQKLNDHLRARAHKHLTLSALLSVGDAL